MSSSASRETWLAAFGDPTQTLWGVALLGAEPAIAVVRGESEVPSPVTLQPAQVGADAGEQWTITSPDAAVTVCAPVGGGEPDVLTSSPEPGNLELCRLAGFERGGAVRCTALPGGDVEAVRLVATWFSSGCAVAVSAARPRGARGQDRDSISVVARGEREGSSVFDPRLSTTYNGDGTPRRTGIELWLGESEDGEQYPRRVAGERLGGRARHVAGGLVLEAYGLRCHARDEVGIGIYVLMRVG